jgi:Ca-activated chloride channel family protein
VLLIMIFGYPWALALLTTALLIALYYAYANQRDKGARESFADAGLLGALGLLRPGRRGLIAPLLIVLAAALASVAMARPLGPHAGDGLVNAGMDVVIALDVSDSMAVQDTKGNRLSAAKDIVQRIVEAAPDNRYGLLLFSGDAVITCPLTLDHDAYMGFVQDADFTRANLPGTAIGNGILAATKFKKGELPRAVVVISDGENTYGDDPVKAAQAAKGQGMKVYAVGVGTASGGRIPSGADFFGNVQYKRDRQGQVVVSRLDEAALKAVADAGGGGYVAASDAGSVDALRKALSVRDAKKIKDPFKDAEEYGGWFSLAAFCLLAAAVAL